MPRIFMLTIILIPILIAIVTAIFQLLWNTTMPDVFGLKKIILWQALRILILAAILFGAGAFITFNISG